MQISSLRGHEQVASKTIWMEKGSGGLQKNDRAIGAACHRDRQAAPWRVGYAGTADPEVRALRAIVSQASAMASTATTAAT